MFKRLSPPNRWKPFGTCHLFIIELTRLLLLFFACRVYFPLQRLLMEDDGGVTF